MKTESVKKKDRSSLSALNVNSSSPFYIGNGSLPPPCAYLHSIHKRGALCMHSNFSIMLLTVCFSSLEQ